MPNLRLCATVTAPTLAALRARRAAAEQAGADLVEVRLDTMTRPDVPGALADRTRPVVVTCRPTWEGGGFAGSEAERRRLLLEACARGAEYVDVEARAAWADDVIAARGGRGVVLSFHAFDDLPADLADRYRAMRATGADVVKLAVRVRSLDETLRVTALGQDGEPRVLIGLGPAGVPSRVLAGRLGSCWTYAGAAAPGQIDIERMRREFAVQAITARTAIYGVLGSPVSHSLSPAMHNAGFRAAGLDAVYLPLEAADLDDFSRFARAVGLRGASVTAPFKAAAAARVAACDRVGRAVGAVNTLRIDHAGGGPGDGAWHGCNTDVAGFLAPLAGRIALRGARATVVGAGGAARAAAFALRQEGAAVTICARRAEAAAAAAQVTGAAAAPLPPPPGSWDLLVNATPIGTAPDVDRSPLPDARFDGRLVYDLVYNPAATRLLTAAAQAGCDTLGGLEMLVAQAERQFAWWTGAPPPAGLFRAAAARDLARRTAEQAPRAGGLAGKEPDAAAPDRAEGPPDAAAGGSGRRAADGAPARTAGQGAA